MAARAEYDYYAEPVDRSLSRPQFQLLTMLIFLTLIGFLVAILAEPIIEAFQNNPGLNGLIFGVLAIGILYAFRQVIRLYPEIKWVNSFRLSDPNVMLDAKQPELLAPMANMLRDRSGPFSLSAASMRSILDSIGARLDEARDTSRYLVGLLIFLGLLGTFWGLLETINSVGNTISSLDVGGGDSALIFEDLKRGLEAPLSGMGTAFSSSLFGLAGSLVLGFLDLQASQAQNRFYNELEDWLAAVTQIETGNPASDAIVNHLRLPMMDMHRSLHDMGAKLDANLQALGQQAARSPANGDSEVAVRDLAQSIEKLVRQMRAEQTVVREWVDEQAGQQAELAQLIRQLSAHFSNERM